MNKYQEAYNKLKIIIWKLSNDKPLKRYFEPMLILYELVDKATPKKPDYEGDGYCDGQIVYDTWICPNCGKRYEMDYDEYDYCPKCGQAIDWSECND